MKSVAQRLIAHLQKYRSIDTWEIIKIFHVTQPGREIHLLREQCWNIKTAPTKRKRRDTKEEVTIATYWLDDPEKLTTPLTHGNLQKAMEG